MAETQKQPATMPPEQRRMMQDTMAKLGRSMAPGAGGGLAVKICMTKEMIERNELPAQQGDRKTTTTPRMATA